MGEPVETVVDIWGGDQLGRRYDAKLLQQFLTRRMAELRNRGKTACYTLNIDAGWGQGKSFFLERFKQQLESNNFRVASINAWAEDYIDDPLVGVMAALLNTFKAEKSSATKKSVQSVAAATGKVIAVLGKHATKAAVTRALGEDGAELVEAIGEEIAKGTVDSLADLGEAAGAKLGNALVKRFEESRRTVVEFKTRLAKLIAADQANRPTFVLIDELDRCRPTHAVAMLERIKHLFDIDGLVFIVATDTEQLRHAISAVYGVGFDGRGYLSRFFDRTYRFPPPERLAFVTSVFAQQGIELNKFRSPPDNKNHLSFIAKVTDAFDMPLRDIQRCCDMLETTVTLWDKPYPIILPIMLPLLIAATTQDRELFDAIATQRDVTNQMGRRLKRVVKFSFPRFDPYRRPAEPQLIDLTELVNTILAHRHERLHEIFEFQRNSDPQFNWAIDCYAEEFRSGHGNVIHGNGPLSTINRYAELVGRVGRLTADDGETPSAA